MRAVKILPAAALAMCLPAAAIAHDVATEDDVRNLSARMDSLESNIGNQNDIIQDIYENIDELKARLDAGAAKWDQWFAIEDIYATLDRIAEAMGSARSEEAGEE